MPSTVRPLNYPQHQANLTNSLVYRLLTATPTAGFEPLLGKSTYFPVFGVSLACIMLDTERARTVELAGEWIGHYPGHFDEVIRICQEGDEVEAIKITGDEYVPAGELTWRANLRTLHGEGQIAEREFVRPRFVPGRLIILNPERIVFRWNQCGEVEYRRDD